MVENINKKIKKWFEKEKYKVKKYGDAYWFYSDIRTLETGVKMYVPKKSQSYYLEKIKRIKKTAKFSVPRKPNFKYYPETRYEPAESYVTCPSCGEELDPELEEGYCPCCGQELDWSYDED